MSEPRPIHVIELTPPGRGAIATIRVEGAGAAGLIDRHVTLKSGRRLMDCEPNRLLLGHFGPPPAEQIVTRRSADDAVELHCHGGRAVIDMILSGLAADGAEIVSWRDWVGSRADDPIQRDAWQDLAKACTQRTASILLDQFNGALRRALDEIQAAIARGDGDAARRLCGELLARAPLGRHLVEPWKVVLAGRPNVGKSSLINALLGYARAIVHHEPGTTRDFVTGQTAFDGWPIELTDTAGLRDDGGAIERAGVEKARQQFAMADLILVVVDGSLPRDPADESGAILDAWSSVLLVKNKCDLPQSPDWPENGLSVSALCGNGIERLVAEVASRLVPEPPPAGAAVPFRESHVEQIRCLRSQINPSS